MTYKQITVIQCDKCGDIFHDERDEDGDISVYTRTNDDGFGIHVCLRCIGEFDLRGAKR